MINFSFKAQRLDNKSPGLFFTNQKNVDLSDEKTQQKIAEKINFVALKGKILRDFRDALIILNEEEFIIEVYPETKDIIGRKTPIIIHGKFANNSYNKDFNTVLNKITSHLKEQLNIFLDEVEKIEVTKRSISNETMSNVNRCIKAGLMEIQKKTQSSKLTETIIIVTIVFGITIVVLLIVQ